MRSIRFPVFSFGSRASIIKAQGRPEPAGQAKITRAYNLPCRYVRIRSGPAVAGAPSQKDRDLLASCYRSCLALAEKHGLRSITFCCISTGEFHFPRREAAEIAVKTVKEYLNVSPGLLVVFNVFTEEDHKIYHDLLRRSSTGESSSGQKAEARLEKAASAFCHNVYPSYASRSMAISRAQPASSFGVSKIKGSSRSAGWLMMRRKARSRCVPRRSLHVCPYARPADSYCR